MDVASRWTTMKGDEWRYAHKGITASGDLSGDAFSIRPTFEPVNAASLHELLKHTSECFRGFSIRVRVTKETEPLLRELSSSGILSWHPISQPFGVDACIRFALA